MDNYVFCRFGHVTTKKQNGGRGLHFQTLVLMWFWISAKFPFQRYMTWPPSEKKNIFCLYDVVGLNPVTSQEIWPCKDFRFNENWMFRPYGLQKSKNLRCLFILILIPFPANRDTLKINIFPDISLQVKNMTLLITACEKYNYRNMSFMHTIP